MSVDMSIFKLNVLEEMFEEFNIQAYIESIGPIYESNFTEKLKKIIDYLFGWIPKLIRRIIRDLRGDKSITIEAINQGAKLYVVAILKNPNFISSIANMINDDIANNRGTKDWVIITKESINMFVNMGIESAKGESITVRISDLKKIEDDIRSAYYIINTAFVTSQVGEYKYNIDEVYKVLAKHLRNIAIGLQVVFSDINIAGGKETT